MLDPNEGAPVGFEVNALPPNCDVGSGGTFPPNAPVELPNIEARKGLAIPPPVICGLNPTPTVEVLVPPSPIAPVGCAFKAPIPP